MKKILFGLLLFCVNVVIAQNNFDFNLDYAQFAYDSTSNYVEYYFSFSKNGLIIQKNKDGKFVAGEIRIKLESKKNKKLIMEKTWAIKSKTEDSNKVKRSQLLLGVIGVRIPRGLFDAEITAFDIADSTHKKVLHDVMEIKPFISSHISISSPQLAKNILQDNADKKSIFYKNSYEVIPNPSIIYSASSPVLFFYSELYNLKSDKSKNKLLFKKLLYNNSGKVLYTNTQKVSKKQNSIVEAGLINLAKYPTGIYRLELALLDTSAEIGAISSKTFYFYNPSIKDTTQNTRNVPAYMSSEFGVYTKDECDKFFDESKYIATSKEINQYAQLTTLIGKRKFLYNFWKRRDPNPSTPENEFEIKYKKRIRFADRKFGILNRAGYKTDRGRIYLTYGPYDEIDRYPNESNTKPYEIWYYNSIEGGVIFVFANLTGYSDYELIHSTKRGEMHDYNWRARLRQN